VRRLGADIGWFIVGDCWTFQGPAQIRHFPLFQQDPRFREVRIHPDDVLQSWDCEGGMRVFLGDSVSFLNPDHEFLQIPRAPLHVHAPLVDARRAMGQGIRASLECGHLATGHTTGGPASAPVFTLIHCTDCFPALEPVKRKLECLPSRIRDGAICELELYSAVSMGSRTVGLRPGQWRGLVG
jgi:hypothetical protein